MPATCAGITNLRVGIVWQNDNNTSGSDPSFAIDDVSISGTVTPAPIELMSFTAAVIADGTVQLDWVTATEANNDFFTIERSADANDFDAIAFEDGAGNSTYTIEYSKIDPVPLKGLSYYRLKQTDFDHKFSYSGIVPVNIERSDFEFVNISNEHGLLEVTMNCSGDCMISYELYDLLGKKVSALTKNSLGEHSSVTLPLASLNTGIYLLKAFNGEKMITRKIKL
jgi:hypothetical protein